MHYSNMMTLLMLVLEPVVRGDIKILDVPYGSVGSAPCARTCAGIGRWNDGDWLNSSLFLGKVLKDVQISDCDFVTPPVVTAATRHNNNSGGRGTFNVCPSVFVRSVAVSSFYVYSVEDTTATKMREARCDVYWSAFGYVC